MNKKRKKRNRLYLWVAGTLSTILIGGVLYSGFAPVANLHAASVTSEDSSSQVAKDTEGELEDLNYPREDFDDLLSDSAYLAEESDLLSETSRDATIEPRLLMSKESLIGTPDPSWGEKKEQYQYWNDGQEGSPIIEYYTNGVIWIGPGKLTDEYSTRSLYMSLMIARPLHDVKYIVICGGKDANGKLDLNGYDYSSGGIFGGLTQLRKIKGLGNIINANGRSLAKAFYENPNLIGADFEKLDTSKATSLKSAFYKDSFKNLEEIVPDTGGLSYFDSINNGFRGVKNWNVSKVTDMDQLFGANENLTTIDLSWKTPALKSAYSMFSSCLKLTRVNLGFTEINSEINGDRMFQDCKSLYSVNLQSWWLKDNNRLFMGAKIPQYLILGAKTPINGSELGALTSSESYTGGWERVESESNPIPTTPPVEFASSAAFMSNYQGGTQAGTYTWQKVKPKKPATFDYSGDLIFQPTDLPFSSEDGEGQFIFRANESKFYFEVKDTDQVGWTVNMRIVQPFHEEDQTETITQLGQALRYVKSSGGPQIILDNNPKEIISQTDNFSTKDSWTPDTGVLMYLTNEQAESLAEKIKTENKDKPADPEGNNTITVSYSATIAIEFVPTQPQP